MNKGRSILPLFNQLKTFQINSIKHLRQIYAMESKKDNSNLSNTADKWFNK